MTQESPQGRLGRSSNEVLESTSFLFGANAQYIEALYARYLENPESVEPSWRGYFDELRERGRSLSQSGPSWQKKFKPEYEDGELIGALTGLWPRDARATHDEADIREAAKDSIRAIQLVRAYRVIGHLAADLDPLRLSRKAAVPQLDPGFYGFHDSDLD